MENHGDNRDMSFHHGQSCVICWSHPILQTFCCQGFLKLICCPHGCDLLQAWIEMMGEMAGSFQQLFEARSQSWYIIYWWPIRVLILLDFIDVVDLGPVTSPKPTEHGIQEMICREDLGVSGHGLYTVYP